MCGRGRRYGPQGYGCGGGWGAQGSGWGGRGGGWCHGGRGGGWGGGRRYGGCHGRRFSGPTVYPQLAIPQQPTHERRRSEGSISNVYTPPKPTVIERKPVARTDTTLSKPTPTTPRANLNTTPPRTNTTTKLRKSSEPSRSASTKTSQPPLPERRLSLPASPRSERPDFKDWGPPPPYVEPAQTSPPTRHNSVVSRTSSSSSRSEPIVPVPLFRRDSTISRSLTRENSVRSFTPSVPELILPEDPDPFEDQSDYEELPEPHAQELISPISDEGYGTLSEADLRNLPKPRENRYNTQERQESTPALNSRDLNVGPWFPHTNPPYPRSEASFVMDEQNAPRRPPKIPLDRPAEEGWLIPVIVEPDGDIAVDAVRQMEQERNESGGGGGGGESGVRKLGKRVLGRLI